MKALTLYQPWASLIAVGAKRFETRSWPTEYRGRIAIHAAITNKYCCSINMDHRFLSLVYNTLMPFYSRYFRDLRKDIPYGAVVATAELVGCHIIHNDHDGNTDKRFAQYIERPNYFKEYIQGNEYVFGDFSTGRYAWEFKNVKMLDIPIPTKGNQGLWEFNERLLKSA